MGASRGLRYEWVGADAATLQRLRPAWTELSARAIEPNPFFEPALLEPAAAHFPALAPMSLLLVWRADHLIALLPAVPRRVRRLRSLAMGVTTALHPHCYITTPLIAADDSAAALDGLLDGIDRAVPFGLAWLDGIDGNGPFVRLLAERSLARGQPGLLLAREHRALLRPDPSGPDHYLATTLDRRELRDLERRRRGLTGMGTLETRPLTGDASSFVEAFLALEAAGWKGQSGTAMASTPADTAFLREMATALNAQGRLRGHGLLLDGEWIAVTLDIVAGEGCFAFKTAYDERFRRFSPGKLLEIETIRSAHAPEAPRWFDSCTAPDNAMLGKLWRERRTIERWVVAGRSVVSRSLLRLLAHGTRYGLPPIPQPDAVPLRSRPA